MYVYFTHVIKKYWNNGLSCLVWLWQWSKASRFYFLREKTMQCWLHVTNRALSTKAILSRKMILAGREEHIKIRCPVKLQLCVSKVCSDCGSQWKLEGFAYMGTWGQLLLLSHSGVFFHTNPCTYCTFLKFLTVIKLFPCALIIGLKFWYVRDRKTL